VSAATSVFRVRLRAADLIRIRVEPSQFGIAIEFAIGGQRSEKVYFKYASNGSVAAPVQINAASIFL
jgi:hypothetical protein